MSGYRLDVYHASTHDMVLVRIWNAGLKCAAFGSLKIQDAKIRHNAPSAHLGKNLLHDISSTCLHNTVNFGPLTAEIDWRVWAPQQISSGLTSWLRYCSDVTQRRWTKLCTMFGRLLGWYTIYIFLGALALNRIFPGTKSTLYPSFAFSYIGNITARHLSSVCPPNFAVWYKEWNYRTFARHFCSLEFRKLENSLQMEKLKQMHLTMSFSNYNWWASYTSAL